MGNVMTLESERKYYESIRADLLKHHRGKFALIVGSELLGVFDSPNEAYKAGTEKRGNVPMLIAPIGDGEITENLPAMTLGILRARL